jgi:type II secretory pathway pseudopilin PulG
MTRRPTDALSRLRAMVRRDDTGFTLIEITIATGLVMTVLVLMAGVLSSGITSTAVARQRQSADGIANQTLEQVRALPFETLAEGLSTPDLAVTAGTSDPRVEVCGGTYCFDDETIVHSADATGAPLVPHSAVTTTGPTEFTVSTYVTYYEDQLDTQTFRVTAHVAWTSNVRGGSEQQVEVQTITHSPSSSSPPNACLSLEFHPFSGPCQPSFTASAVADPGTIEVTGTVDGIGVQRALLSGGRASSDLVIEQISRAEGLAQGSTVVLQETGGSEQTVGGASVASQADNDPSDTKPTHDTGSLSSQAAANASLTTSPTGSSVAASITAGGALSSTSTTSAATERPCPNLSGVTNETDSQPCGGSRSTTTSTTTLDAAVHVGALNVASFPLAAVGPQVNPSTAITDRAIGSSDGTARAEMTRSAIDFKVGALPALLFPATGFDGFVQLSGHTDTTTAQAGVDSAAPTATRGGTLRFWVAGVEPGTGAYTNVAVSDINPSTTIPPLTFFVEAPDTTVSFSATVTPGTTSVESDCTGTCTRTTATAKVTPLTVTVTMTITVASQEAVNLTFELDPGANQATTSYASTPTS